MQRSSRRGRAYKGAFPLGRGPGLLGIVFLAVACALPVCAQEGALSVHTGFGFVSGDFGLDVDTDIEYVPLSVTYAFDPWRFELAGSYLRVTGPSDVVVGANGVSTNAANAGGSSTGLRTDSGPGDLLATGSYWFQLAESTYLDVHFSTKLPLADEDRNLGTGQLDYTGRVGLSATYESWTPTIELGYRFLGESARFLLDDGLIASVGVHYRHDGALSGGLLLDFAEPSSATSGDTLELVPYFEWRSGTLSTSGYGVIGFAEGSPDYGLGVQISFSPR